MVNSEYFKDLNKAQKEAVKSLDGPLLIVAGAGSGKTKVLTSRIANIIKEPYSFSTFTFWTDHWFRVSVECKIIVIPYDTITCTYWNLS